MFTRRYGAPLGIALALIALGPMPATSAPGSDAGREASSEASRVWLTLDWIGNWLPIGEHLTVNSQGEVRLRLESGTRGDRIGLFGFTLPPQRLANLRDAVKRARVSALDDEYPVEPDATEVEWVTLGISDPELGRKQVKASNRSRYCPLAMRSLFRFRVGPHPVKGALNELIREAAEKPIAAIRFSVSVPARRFRKGEPVNADAIITNIGREPVILPSLECKTLVKGYVDIGLWNAASHKSGGFAATEFGWLSQSDPGPLDAAKADLANVVRLAPGEQRRVFPPKPLVAPSAGEYTVFSDLHMFEQYDLAALTQALGKGFVSGWVCAEPVDIIVSE